MNSLTRILLCCGVCLLTAACGSAPVADRPSDQPATAPTSASVAGNSAARPADNPASSLPKIVAFGDSLTAGYGLATADSYPSQLQNMLERDGYRFQVVNAGVSGDTTAGGVQRIDWALEGDVRVLILELGANDMLRGLPVKAMRENLAQIIQKAKARNVQVLLAGMYATTNSGPEYQAEFQAVFESLAREYDVPLIPFFLARVAGIETLNLEDGAHPNAEGTKIVADTVYQALRPLLDQPSNEPQS